MLGTSNKKQAEIPVKMQCISKTVRTDNGKIVKGTDVETHCKIVGIVAEELISLFPEWFINQFFPDGTGFIAACHDVGKISPDFQVMIHRRIDGWSIKDYPELTNANFENAGRKKSGFHAKVSQVCLENKSNVIAKIAGIHHGFKPTFKPFAESAYGGIEWTNKRHELITVLEKYFNISPESWPRITGTEQANIISGLVTVADWIGSGGIFSNLRLNDSIEDDKLDTMASKAIDDAGFTKITVRNNLSFQDIFGFEPNTIQKTLTENINEPGVYILEAPTGIGKTEAALFSAYKLIHEGKATGLYFALPTQLTSNKIHDRVNEFLSKIIPEEINVSSAKLLHSLAWLEEKVFGEDADSGKSWFDAGKRGILAPFAVGTIDQALMAVMNIRHALVRAFGLAGKIVILDEVHSYDAYTGTIMNELVSSLSKAGSTVIILSATLTEAQKRNIVSIGKEQQIRQEYPLVTALPSSSEMHRLQQINGNPSADRKIKIVRSSEIEPVIDMALEKAEQGQQILWIENTVADAQMIFQVIRARSDLEKTECGLLHSRFIRKERAINEDYWVALLGKSAGPERKNKGRILVGTQILEQSLDIDADFLVSRLCPTDMLIQRLGRLWRHGVNDAERPSSSRLEAIIIAPEYNNVISERMNFGKSSSIYSKYVLCRTLEIWDNLSEVSLPGNTRDLLERTYSERAENGILNKYKTDMESKKKILKGQALLGLSDEINTLPESHAQTRYSELESIDVLIVKSFSRNNNTADIRFIDDTSISITESCGNGGLKRKIASSIINNCARVTNYLAPNPVENLEWLKELKEYIYIGGSDDEEQPFRVALVGKDDEIRSLNKTIVNNKYTLWYDSVCGYRAEKKGGKEEDDY